MENNCAVRLDDCNKIKAIKVYRTITGLNLKECKNAIDNTPGIIFDKISLSEAKDIIAKFQVEDCQASVCISSKKDFCDALSKNNIQPYEEVDASKLSGNELLVVLKRVKDTILSIEQLNNEMETTNKAVENVVEESKEKESQAGGITFIGIGIGALLGISLLGIIGLIIGFLIGFFVGYSIDNKVNEQKYLEQSKQYYNEKYPDVEKRKNEIKNAAKVFFNSPVFIEAQEVIPRDYFDIESVENITKMIENRRADTLKEAINMYEDHLHKTRIEEMQKQQVIATQEAADAQKQTAQATQQQVNISQDIYKNAKATKRATQLNTFINFVKK